MYPDGKIKMTIMDDPRPIIHAQFEEIDELNETERGTGCFGSTSQK